MITDFYGNKCSKLGSPYINNCDYDAAVEILSYIYNSKLNSKYSNDIGISSNLFEFDQTSYIQSIGSTASALSMDTTGYIYVPSSCQNNNSSCKVHIAYHGCQQSYSYVGLDYVNDSGYNRWAETNGIIVIYPQTASKELSNPEGCWDWWGFTSANYVLKEAPQLLVMKEIIKDITVNVEIKLSSSL